MGRLDQKIAVITGSATGIGQATALVFAEQGATVVCADVSLEKAQQTVEQITQQGGKAEAVHVDVSDVESVEQLAKHVKETYGTVDVLFNNAGKSTSIQSISSTGSLLSIYAVHSSSVNS